MVRVEWLFGDCGGEEEEDDYGGYWSYFSHYLVYDIINFPCLNFSRLWVGFLLGLFMG